MSQTKKPNCQWPLGVLCNYNFKKIAQLKQGRQLSSQLIGQKIFRSLAVILLWGTFGLTEIQADTDAAKSTCENTPQGEVCFEVLLEAPFVKTPDQGGEKGKCEKADKDGNYVCTNEDGTEFKFIKGPEEGTGTWFQVIRGKDGGEILANYAQQIYFWLAAAIGIFAVLFLIIGGLQIMLGGANQESVSSGRKRILAAILGLVLLFLASLILRTINPNFFT